MFKETIIPLICKKSGLNFIIFSHDFKILDFDEDISNISDDIKSLKVGNDIRDCFWEFIGHEENIFNLYINNSVGFKIPMIFKNSQYYDIEIELLKEENVFFAYIIKKAEFSNQYLKAIQILNKKTLISQTNGVKIEKGKNYYDLINQNILRFHVDLDGIILEVNSICVYFLGKDENELIGKHFSEFFHTRESKLNDQSKIINAQNAENQNILFHADIIPIHQNGIVIENIIICQDITHVKKIEQELHFASSHDSLTGLMNRSSFLKKVDASISFSSKDKKDKKGFTLCFLHLSNLDYVNSKHGYHAGDMLLKHASLLLKDIIRSFDIISRIAANEFVLLLQEIEDVDSINSTINRIQNIQQNKPLTYNENDIIYLDFTLGIATYPEHGKDTKTLLSHAIKVAKRKKSDNKREYEE